MSKSNLAPIHPTDDPRVKHAYANVNDGLKLHYVIGEPKSGNAKATVVLVHGFPDMWYGWRHTIPALLSQDLRTIAIDCIGYGGSDSPRSPPHPLSTYSLKSNADAIASLLSQLHISKAIILCHDWGTMISYRLYNHHPHLVSHIISLCVPYAPPHPGAAYQPLEEVVLKLPNFKYQLAFADRQTEKELKDRNMIKKFLTTVYRGVGDGGAGFFKVEKPEELMEKIKGLGCQRGWVLTEEELEYYTDQFSKNGMHGPLSYYRTREVNYQDEQSLHDPIIYVPTLFIGATRDAALPLSMSYGQDRYIPDLTRREVVASHWVAWEKKDEVNDIITKWIADKVFHENDKIPSKL